MGGSGVNGVAVGLLPLMLVAVAIGVAGGSVVPSPGCAVLVAPIGVNTGVATNVADKVLVGSIVAVGMIGSTVGTLVAVSNGWACATVGVTVGISVDTSEGKAVSMFSISTGPTVPFPTSGLGWIIRCTCRYQALPTDGPFPHPSGP